MENTNFYPGKAIPQPGKSRPFFLHSLWLKPSFLAFLCICFASLILYSPKPDSNQSTQITMDPDDMVHNNFYYFGDHGNGLEIVQFDRMEGDNVYTSASMRPSTLSYSGAGLWGPTANTGFIRLATLSEITHLLLCIAAGVYVPLL
jgi:hypothetical protein